jgi:hypothetical protein
MAIERAQSSASGTRTALRIARTALLNYISNQPQPVAIDDAMRAVVAQRHLDPAIVQHALWGMVAAQDLHLSDDFTITLTKRR